MATWKQNMPLNSRVHSVGECWFNKNAYEKVVGKFGSNSCKKFTFIFCVSDSVINHGCVMYRQGGPQMLETFVQEKKQKKTVCEVDYPLG